MYYNLLLFGKEVCKIRNKLGYTQKYVCNISTINIDTMRKIENGKVTPNQITLELLSPVLKVDLNLLLLKYRLNNYNRFVLLKDKIETQLENGHFDSLINDLNTFKSMIQEERPNTYMESLLKQYCLLVESVIIKINESNYDKALDLLMEAIRLTTPEFDTSTYNNYVYSDMEIRILMNMALLHNKLESATKGLEILEFCLKALDEEQVSTKIKILYNLSYNCYRIDLHEKCLYYSNLGISTCITYNDLTCLPLLYARKSISEYYLKSEDYNDSMMKAITLFDVTGQNKLKSMFLQSFKKIHLNKDLVK